MHVTDMSDSFFFDGRGFAGCQCDRSWSVSENIRVKLGNFGHQVKSDIHLQTV